ncbi:MAG: undecaprenyl-diphosphate phosphatase [Planctomycetota bacterium]
MGTAQAILLGALQGLTEFLPVSSSAHLVAAQRFLDVRAPGILLEVALHFGTLVAIVLVLWRSLWRLVRDGLHGASLYARRADRARIAREAPLFGTAVAVVVGTLPAGLAGVLLGPMVERFFESLTAAGLFLICTGLLLLASRFAPRPVTSRVGPVRGLMIGAAQAFALLPGISRSGSTIAAGTLLGLNRDVAGRFSFLLAVPALIGAALVELVKERPMLSGDSAALAPLMWGVAAAAVTGVACLVLLLRLVRRGRLHWFAAYCIPAGLAMAAAGLAG